MPQTRMTDMAIEYALRPFTVDEELRMGEPPMGLSHESVVMRNDRIALLASL